MAIPDKVNRWRPIIAKEIGRGSFPFPQELILSLVSYESGGNAGIVNPQSGASGLLQVMPNTLDWYNSATGSAIPLAIMRSASSTAAVAQIRVGLWALGEFWRAAYKWIRDSEETVAVDELVRFGDAFYAAGPGRIKQMLGDRRRRWDTWTAIYPKSNITKHAVIVWDRTKEQAPQWNLEKIDDWVESGPSPIVSKNRMGGIILALLILAIASYALSFFDKKNRIPSEIPR